MRLLLGIATLLIIIPGIAFVMPETLDRLDIWGDDSTTIDAGPEALAISSTPEPEGESTVSTRGTHAASESEATVPETSLADPRPSSSGTADREKPQTSAEPGKAGDRAEAQSTSSSAGVVGGVLSGDVCPCSVSGTVVLDGRVDLKGDLMVMGGTLVARPGVVVNGNGFQIMFMEGGRADFQGSPVSTWSNNGSQMNLKRDIEFHNLRRIMFHGAGPSTLKYFTVTDSGTPDVLGDYPIHFHLNANSTRGTIVEGVVVVNGRNHAYVPHGSHGITFKDTIAYNIRGDAYWWDPGQGENDSTDIVYDHALAHTVTPAASGKHRLTGFMLRGGDNTVKNSAAVNIKGGSDCSGFHWPENAGPNAVWTFTNNHSSSPDCNGIFVWQNDDEPHIINGFTGSGIDHGAYSNEYQYNNVKVDHLQIQALGWTINNSTIGDVTTHAHNDSAKGKTTTITNTQIKTFTIDNGNGKAPGNYILNNTNLTCNDIKYTSTYPGTQITINGTTC